MQIPVYTTSIIEYTLLRYSREAVCYTIRDHVPKFQSKSQTVLYSLMCSQTKFIYLYFIFFFKTTYSPTILHD